MKDHRALGTHGRYCGLTMEDLFWAKVTKGDGCWLFKRIDKLGYGRFDRKGPYVFAHRAAWLYTHGEIPAGLDVCHTCDVRNCCNPAHLFLGTATDNMRDMIIKGRSGSTTLTPADVRRIRSLFAIKTTKEIAAEYGVTYSAIWGIKSGTKWKHLDGDSRP